jgi:hypothetical protein
MSREGKMREPAYDEYYCYINKDGDVCITHWKNTLKDRKRFKAKNVYPDLERAYKKIEITNKGVKC